MEPVPEESLLSRASREAFVRECYEGLFRWFYRLTGSREWSADLTQESFASFWEAQDRRPRASVPGPGSTQSEETSGESSRAIESPSSPSF